jgi:putative redox protein
MADARHHDSPVSKRTVQVELVWTDKLQFGATTASSALVVDGDGEAGPSPVQLLATALLGCMSADVVDILQKGRHAFTGFHAALSGDRLPNPPRRLARVTLRFTVHGRVPAAAIERAIALSREKYCSVWHSLRQDIELATAFDVVA